LASAAALVLAAALVFAVLLRAAMIGLLKNPPHAGAGFL